MTCIRCEMPATSEDIKERLNSYSRCYSEHEAQPTPTSLFQKIWVSIFMSIKPTTSQGSASSSSTRSLSQNPNPDHGTLLPQPPSPSLRFSGASPLAPVPDLFSGSVAQAAEDFGGSHETVTELGTTNGGKKTWSHQSIDTECRHSGGHKVGSSRARGKTSGASVSLSPRDQQTTGSTNYQGSNAHSAGRKGQVTSGNHLLNFQYDPIARSQPRTRAPPPRRLVKRRPYNKDLFLQANYKFVVLASANYDLEMLDPDKTLQWENIICVRYSTPFPVQCPICLEYPTCPQITSCGHVFCFPCILQYLLMGEEDTKGDCWKRCPLCFVMICPKDLFTLHIENVTEHCVGDAIEFTLLTRQKGSYIPSMKSKGERSTQSSSDNIYDVFSKFTFTSDVDLSVRKAISDLDGWLIRADSGLVDDIEKLPYVCAAREQLEQRKKYWNEHRACDNSRSCEYKDCPGGSHVPSSATNATKSGNEEPGHGQGTLFSNIDEQSEQWNELTSIKLGGRTSLDQAGESVELQGTFSPSGESSSLNAYTNGSRDVKDNDSYNFYQAVDGQHIVLHPLNMKCFLHHYGSYDNLPQRISGRILQLETMTQSEAMRRRYRYLSHFSLTTTFQLCEIDMSEMLPFDSLRPSIDEIKKREKQRKQLAKKERKEKIKAEAASSLSVPILFGFGQSSRSQSPAFSMDDFGALGNATVASTSPPIVGERKLFSNVTKLGFAAAHDSPALKIEEASSPQSNGVGSDAGGLRNAGAMSFANVILKEKSVENLNAPKMNEMGKKGKKPSRVLLSTAGGRRY